MKIAGLIISCAFAIACTGGRAETPPAPSIYQLPIALTNQDGSTAPLADLRGGPAIITMFYTSCQFVCPMTLDTIQKIESTLPAAQRARLRVVVVSFDPARDTVPVLREVATRHDLDTPRWALARTDAASVRKLAVLLGINYRKLPDGDFNHTTSIILLDADGRIVARTPKVGSVDTAFAARVRDLLSRD